MYLADISVPVADAGGVYQTLSLRRGEISEEIPRPGTPMTAIRAFLPVREKEEDAAGARGSRHSVFVYHRCVPRV